MLADATAQIVGTPVAADPGRQLVLYRVDGPVRTRDADRPAGTRDTWTGAARRLDAPRVHAAACCASPVRSDPQLFAGVTQRIAVSGDDAGRVILSAVDAATKTIVAAARAAAAASASVRFDVSPTRAPATPATTRAMLGVLVDWTSSTSRRSAR